MVIVTLFGFLVDFHLTGGSIPGESCDMSNASIALGHVLVTLLSKATRVLNLTSLMFPLDLALLVKRVNFVKCITGYYSNYSITYLNHFTSEQFELGK